MRSALVLLRPLALSGCVPIISQYPRIEAPDAVYYRGGCWGGSGPPSLVYYPFHGIFKLLRSEVYATRTACARGHHCSVE
jgi:hypothetical protein